MTKPRDVICDLEAGFWTAYGPFGFHSPPSESLGLCLRRARQLADLLGVGVKVMDEDAFVRKGYWTRTPRGTKPTTRART